LAFLAVAREKNPQDKKDPFGPTKIEKWTKNGVGRVESQLI